MPGFETALGALAGDWDEEDVVQGALVAIRNHLGMEVAYFSEFVDGQSVFRRVDAPGLEHLIKPGDSRSLDDVYCNHILAGRLPGLIPDTAQEPLAVAMPITGAVPIGSHASLPIRLRDGTPFGMFCCLSPRPNPTLNPRDLETMRVFADLAARQVNAELDRRRARRDRRAAIHAVIDAGAFAFLYQPILDLCGGGIVAYEALCRFTPQPYRSPDQWFGDAADVGLAVELELKAVEAALTAFAVLPEGVALSVNVSPETAVSAALPGVLGTRPMHRIILELTEHDRVGDYARLDACLGPMRRQGLKVAVDDAGAGYSGLQHIVRIAPDAIKMDMSLTRGLDTDPARRALASAMIFYARETGATLVAEGIETAGELATLRALGFTRGQGYLLGRPAPLATAAIS
ncbi:EAL domain-containing protein (putative c-di-GMP-specific phosphodiesterase class I) [Stella humosa]|uniref:EAL domain-containing protein (Putative c-di-GMP-specific phosphodiesterase class I) n=1 Tax=Stella humosa TaxID=94 RepID=A0A3N1LJL1_9PROT|nr:EAL domain-containing protein [Stella humosa]ROP90606.1 EAL domain-containing protein (putative c-di-GMP-specific phosphodiesterase class I) [Stella humosa]BBK29498.1 hypothetical protein STHU_01320 [Stella humosa]